MSQAAGSGATGGADAERTGANSTSGASLLADADADGKAIAALDGVRSSMEAVRNDGGARSGVAGDIGGEDSPLPSETRESLAAPATPPATAANPVTRSNTPSASVASATSPAAESGSMLPTAENVSAPATTSSSPLSTPAPSTDPNLPRTARLNLNVRGYKAISLVLRENWLSHAEDAFGSVELASAPMSAFPNPSDLSFVVLPGLLATAHGSNAPRSLIRSHFTDAAAATTAAPTAGTPASASSSAATAKAKSGKRRKGGGVAASDVPAGPLIDVFVAAEAVLHSSPQVVIQEADIERWEWAVPPDPDETFLAFLNRGGGVILTMEEGFMFSLTREIVQLKGALVDTLEETAAVVAANASLKQRLEEAEGAVSTMEGELDQLRNMLSGYLVKEEEWARDREKLVGEYEEDRRLWQVSGREFVRTLTKVDELVVAQTAEARSAIANVKELVRSSVQNSTANSVAKRRGQNRR